MRRQDVNDSGPSTALRMDQRASPPLGPSTKLPTNEFQSYSWPSWNSTLLSGNRLSLCRDRLAKRVIPAARQELRWNPLRNKLPPRFPRACASSRLKARKVGAGGKSGAGGRRHRTQCSPNIGHPETVALFRAASLRPLQGRVVRGHHPWAAARHGPGFIHGHLRSERVQVRCSVAPCGRRGS